MKKVLIVAVLLSLAVAAFAANPGSLLQHTDSNYTNGGDAVQGFAPNGKYSQSLAVNSTTIDLRGTSTTFADTAWSVYSPTATCYFRAMSTATKAGVKHTIDSGVNYTRVVNKETPFLNLTGCTSGELQRMKYTR